MNKEYFENAYIWNQSGTFEQVISERESYIAAEMGDGRCAPYRHYPYRYAMIDYSHGEPQESLADRIEYWIKKHPIITKDGTKRPMNISEFARFVTSFTKRWYNVEFKPGLITCYIAQKCSPKIDRCTMLAKAMNVSTQWLQGYGPRSLGNSNGPTLRNMQAEMEAAVAPRNRRKKDDDKVA